MKPTVGRIVHYTTGRGGGCEAAIVTSPQRPDGTIHVTIFGWHGSVRPVESLPEVDPKYPDDAPDAEGWHWPEREDLT